MEFYLSRLREVRQEVFEFLKTLSDEDLDSIVDVDSEKVSVEPPFGFNCRCRVVTLSEPEVRARSLRVRSGSEVSGLPDPGFTSGSGALL